MVINAELKKCTLSFTESTIVNLKTLTEKKAKAVIEKLKSLSLTLTLAESCTAGLVSGLLVNTQGVSSVLWGSFVCYTQESKVQMLGLNNEKLTLDGLVSRQTALSMAEGALQKSSADIAAAVTGLAGPGHDGISPVGTIWVATAMRCGKNEVKGYLFTADPDTKFEPKKLKSDKEELNRNLIRICAAEALLELILKSIRDNN